MMGLFHRTTLTLGSIGLALSLLLAMLVSGIAYASPTVHAMADHSVTVGASTGAPEIDADCRGYDFVTYINANADIQLYNVTTGQNSSTSQASLGAAALVCGSNGLYIAWAADSTADLEFGYFSCATTCSLIDVHQVGSNTSYTAPTLTTNANGTFYLGWTGTNQPSYNLNYAVSTNNGATWSQTELTDYTTEFGGISFYYDTGQGRLWISWTASSGTPYFYLGYYSGSNQLTEEGHSTTYYSSFAPGIYAKNGSIDFIWQGYTVDNIYTGNWDNGWGSDYQQRDTTEGSPAIAYDSKAGTIVTSFLGTNYTVYFDYGAYNY